MPNQFIGADMPLALLMSRLCINDFPKRSVKSISVLTHLFHFYFLEIIDITAKWYYLTCINHYITDDTSFQIRCLLL